MYICIFIKEADLKDPQLKLIEFYNSLSIPLFIFEKENPAYPSHCIDMVKKKQTQKKINETKNPHPI